jgi:hypothetical protein
MITVARVIKRTGQLVAWVGAMTAILSVLSFSFHSIAAVRKYWTTAILVGLAMGLVGMIMERAAKQPDVGRQMRQP